MLVHGDEIDHMVREALTLLGGLRKLGVKGKTVLIKPNVVAGKAFPTTTHPEVIRAIINLLYEEGAKKIYIGDMSALLTLPTRANMKKTGILNVAAETGAEVVSFENHRWVKVDLPRASEVPTTYVSEWIYKADLVINAPVMKTHRSATYSISLKNFIGATHGRQRPYLINPNSWEEIVAELNLAYQTHLNLVDGTHVMVSGGPWSGKTEKAGLILASGDRIATDIVGLSILKHYGQWKSVTSKGVWEQRQIRRAVALGLGVRNGSSVVLKTKSLLQDPSTEFSRLVASVRKFASIGEHFS